MTLKLIQGPTAYPLTLAETKAHLRVDHTDDDSLIQTYIAAATAYADGPVGVLGRALVNQTWQETLDTFPTNEIIIRIPPLIAVIAVDYDDPAGLPATVPSNQYTVDDVSEPGWILPDGGWPATFDGINSVRVRFRAGYIDNTTSPPTGAVPDDIRAALLLYVGAMYAHREEVIAGQAAIQLPWGAEALLRRKRIDISMA